MMTFLSKIPRALSRRALPLLCLLFSATVLPAWSADGPQPQAGSADQGERLTIGAAVQIALRQNPDLQQVVNQVTSGEITLAQKQSDFAPDLWLSATGSKHFDRSYDPLNGEHAGRSYERAAGTLSSTVNLFNGFGDTAALRSAEFELAGLRDSLSRSEQSLVYDTITRFLDALTNRELIAVRRENLEGNRRQLEQVEALYQAGNRPVSDLYQQRAETGSAELDLLLAEREFAVSKLQLLQTIGLSPTTSAVLAETDPAPLENSLLASSAEPLPAEALKLRPDLAARQKQIEAAREQVSQAQAGYWPTLDLSASLNSNYSSQGENGFDSQFFDDNPNAAVGLTLSVPLFDRYLTRNNVAQARLRQSDAQLSLESLNLQAGAEYGQAVQDFLTAQKAIGVTEARLVAAREGLAAMEERYRVGAATLVELTQARAQFAQAGFERVRARFGLLKQGVALAYYRGDWTRMRTLLTRLENSQ
jgi:outer membrane protein